MSVKQVLENPNATTIEVLKCSDVLNLLRTNDQKLMEFLLQPQHIKDIFDILTQTFARSDHKRVMQLFQTNNVNLHRIFSESIPLTEYAFNVLTKMSDHDMYAAGTISRIFQRAIDLWPDEIYDVFHYSDTLYLTVIDNIDKDVVYMTILDSVSDEKEFFSELMWYLFQALLKTSNEKCEPSSQLMFDHPPRRCYLSKDIYSKLPSFGNSRKIINTICILKQYFSLNQPCTEDFGQYVIDFIIWQTKLDHQKIPFYYQLYDIAKCIGHNDKLMEIAIDTVKQATKLPEDAPLSSNPLRSPLVVSALSYLETCAKYFDEKMLKSFVASMIDKRNTQFGLLSTVQIIKAVNTFNPTWFVHFKKTMEQIIALAWNKYRFEQPILVSIIVDLSILLSIDEPSNPEYAENLNEWKRPDFNLSSAKEQSFTFDIDMQFPESAYDINELNQLRWGLPF